jgi:hypothetical protein
LWIFTLFVNKCSSNSPQKCCICTIPSKLQAFLPFEMQGKDKHAAQSLPAAGGLATGMKRGSESSDTAVTHLRASGITTTAKHPKTGPFPAINSAGCVDFHAEVTH